MARDALPSTSDTEEEKDSECEVAEPVLPDNPPEQQTREVCQLQSASTPKQSKGRPYGSKKWTELVVDRLLNAIEEKLPTGSKH